MEGVSIVDKPTMEALLDKLEVMHGLFIKTSAELKNYKTTYLTTRQVCEYIKKSENWVLLHKHDLGCSKRAGTLLFKRQDIDDFINSDYFKKP